MNFNGPSHKSLEKNKYYWKTKFRELSDKYDKCICSYKLIIKKIENLIIRIYYKMEYLDKTLPKFWDLNTKDEFREFDIQFKNTLKKILLYLGDYNYNFSKTYIDRLLNIVKTFLQMSENNFNKAISLSTSLHSEPPSLDIHLKRKKLCRQFQEYIIEMNDTIERNYSIFSNIPHDLENNILSYLPNNDLDRLSKMNIYLKNQVISIKSKRKVNQLPPLGRTMSFNGQNRVRARDRRVERIFRSYPLIMDMIY